jgi:excisionase family DNA binding protein
MLHPTTPDTAAARSAKEALSEPSAQLVVRVHGREVPLPGPAVAAVREALAELADGHGVRVLRDDREVTTQEAADLLNLSRPHLVRLLEQGKLPFHMVGTHHRVLLADVLAYKAERSAKREAAFRDLADEAQKHGLG